MIAAGLFRWLFGRRRRDQFEVSLGAVLARAVERNLAADARACAPVTAQRIETASLVAEVRSHGSGTCIVEIGDSDVADLVLVIPDSFPGAARPSDAVASAWRLAANVADFLRLDAAAEDSGGAPFIRPSYAYAKRYGDRDADELAWRLSGRRSFRLTAAAEGSPALAPVYACVDDSVAARTERAFAEDAGHAAAVRSWALAEAAAAVSAADPPRRLEIRAPRELALGGLFAPQRVPCGKHVLETRFTAVTANADQGATGIWVRGSCSLAGKQWSAWYLFPTAGKEAARAVASCLFRDALRRLGAALRVAPAGPAVSAGPAPDLTGRAQYAALSADVRVSGTRLPLEVLVEHDALVSLIRALCDPAELAPRPGAPSAAILPLLLSLNQSLLRRELPSLHKAFVEQTAEGDLFPFSAFLDLLPDNDAALLLQNYLPRALAGRSLRALFSYTVPAKTAEGGEAVRLVTPAYLDTERLLRFFPLAVREAWDRGPHAAAKGPAEYRALNREMLAGAWRAAHAGSPLLSPRALYVLERMVVPQIRLDAHARMEELAAAGVPFAALHGLSRPRVEQLLATQPTRSLCLSLLAVPSERAFVEAHCSRTRRGRIEEELALLAKRLEAGAIEADEIVDAMRGIEAAAAAAAEKASRPAGA